MVADRYGSTIVQRDWYLHRQSERRLLTTLGRPYRDDAKHVLFTVQETIRGSHQLVGRKVGDDPGRLRRMVELSTRLALFGADI